MPNVTAGAQTKWLDLTALCQRFLPLVAQARGSSASLQEIWFFSAPPTHRSQEKQARHALYVTCLRGTGVHVSLAQFKRAKEKETDVAIAAKLFEICHTDVTDSTVLVSGDTDLAPAVRTCLRLFPEKTLLLAFPYRRVNDELRLLALGSFKIKAKTYGHVLSSGVTPSLHLLADHAASCSTNAGSSFVCSPATLLSSFAVVCAFSKAPTDM